MLSPRAGEYARGPWNEGNGPWPEDEEWEYIDDPITQVRDTTGQDEKEPIGHERDPKVEMKKEKTLAKQRSSEVNNASSDGTSQWSSYGGEDSVRHRDDSEGGVL